MNFKTVKTHQLMKDNFKTNSLILQDFPVQQTQDKPTSFTKKTLMKSI